jgi:hypothetical protein
LDVLWMATVRLVFFEPEQRPRLELTEYLQ